MRKKLQEDYTGVQTWFFLFGLILFNILGAFAIVGLNALLGPQGEPSNLSLGFVFIGAAVVSVVILVAVDRAWNRHYRRAWRYLKYTGLASLVIDEAAWEEVLAQTKENLALKATGLARPRRLDELLELAADYWRSAQAQAGGASQAVRRRALRWDNGTRLYNNMVERLCNNCAAIMILIIFSAFLIVAFPLLYAALYFYMQQHAAKSAYVDYFLNAPRCDLKKLKPL